MGKNGTILVVLFFVVLIILLHTYQVSTASCIKQERESLLRLKASFIDSSNRLSSWKGTDCCSWKGVGCDHTIGGHVVKLDLRNYEYTYSSALLSNGVDSSLFELKYLTYLDLSANFFNYTQTPHNLAEMLELTYLNLSCTYFHGGIPRSLENLTKLVVLDFNNHMDVLDFFYPAKLFIDGLGWVSSLSSLEYLDLSGVSVVQSKLGLDLMQVLNHLPSSLLSLKLSFCGLQNTRRIFAPPNSSFLSKIQHLDLSANMFVGPIPSILQNMTSLRFLDLYGNRYNTSIPSWLSNFRNLDTLNLGSNLFSSIEGGLFSMVRNHCHLKNLDLSFNWFLGEDVFGNYKNLSAHCKEYGLESLFLNDIQFGTHSIPFPSWLGELKNLKSLKLQGNSLCGPIPSSFGYLSSLEDLDISNNMLNGGLPSWLGELKNLKSLHFQTNSLYGPIPSSFGNLSSLEDLDISNNMLNGGLPSWLGELKNLKSLHFQTNSLYGPIPSSFGNLSSLEELSISDNMLNGGIPISFGKLSNLMYLNLRNNNLDGVIPESFGQLQSLDLLDLSKNDLKGVLSEIHFVNISKLEFLFMDENRLLSFEMKNSWVPTFQLRIFSVRSILGFGTTEFPRWIGTQKKIVYLNLFNTNIIGPTPTWLRFQNLDFLDLSYNQINGPLPKSIDDQMPNLMGLFISNSHINGSLPQSLCRLKNLMLLVVSNNNLSQTIPSCLSALNLDLLDLSSNKLLGVIPSSFQNLSNLEVMNLARNQLQGDPLMAMRSFKSLYVLDLEGNKFCGNIPKWLGKRLQSLQILNLRGNMFNGPIPSTLWLLPSLQILILTDNKLVGNIPPNVGNFSASRESITNDGVVCNSEEDPYALCYVSYITQDMKSSNLNYSYLQLYSMVAIDLSNNNLHGHIPREIVTINGLLALNLSHNNLSGTIPVEIGRSIALESLDFSFNQLSGSIPNSMSGLNSLGALKLSNNNFSGRIPREGHLSTFNDASSYEGNPYLCGDPLSIICPNGNAGEPSIEIDNVQDNDGHEEDKLEKMWFYIIVMIGYALGFWGVVGPLILKRSWRRAYFQFMDETKDKIYVAILINMERLKQRMGGN